MIATALRAEIDAYAQRMRKRNPLFVKAEDGTLGLDSIAFYLQNIRELLRYTPRHLAKARAAAAAIGDHDLAAHYRHKLGEEVGHDQWADDDLTSLNANVQASHAEIGVSMRELIQWIEGIIEEDPTLYLSHILFTEYLIVLLGPEWLALLEARCQVPQSSMSVIGKHADLDRHHVDEAMDEIDRLVGEPQKLRRMRAVMVELTELFDRFSAEVCAHRERAHAPAA